MKVTKRNIKKAANRVKRVVREMRKITVPREDVFERPYPDEIPGWETKGRYRNSGESPKKGAKVLKIVPRTGRKPKKRPLIVYSLAYLNESLPPAMRTAIVRDDRIEPLT